jgi:hypothetical protein
VSNYVKLFGSILHSSIWRQKTAIRCVWITMLAMADRDGVVEASVGGLADAAKVSEPIARKALALFMAPDPDSKSPAFDGRRVEATDGGWRLLNFESYRERLSLEDRRTKNAERQQRHRDRQKAAGVTPDVTDRNAPSRSVTVHNARCSDLLSSSESAPSPKTPDQTRPPARSNVCANGDGLAPPRAPHRLIPVGVVTPAFLDVYEAYPRKDARLKAAVVFHELASEYPGGEEDLAEILTAFRGGMLKRRPYAGENEWRPTLETVLVERRWLDAAPAPDNQPTSGPSAPRLPTTVDTRR